MFAQFHTALLFLTRLNPPVRRDPSFRSEDLVRSFAFFPLVGCIIGGLQALTGGILAAVLPATLAAAWVMAFGTWLTRGFHLDGLADVADGLGGAYEPKRRLQIMKDSRVGAFGVMALVLVLILKVTAFAELLSSARWSAMVVIPVCSRQAMVLCAAWGRYARSEGGLGKAFVEGVGRKELWISGLLTAGLLLGLSGVHGLGYAGLLVIVAWGAARLSDGWLGGITGDLLGAVNEVVEAVLYTAAASSITGLSF